MASRAYCFHLHVGLYLITQVLSSILLFSSIFVHYTHLDRNVPRRHISSSTRLQEPFDRLAAFVKWIIALKCFGTSNQPGVRGDHLSDLFEGRPPLILINEPLIIV